MNTFKTYFSKVAAFVAFFISAVLFVSTNTASSGMVYQPKAPSELKRFSKIR